MHLEIVPWHYGTAHGNVQRVRFGRLLQAMGEEVYKARSNSDQDEDKQYQTCVTQAPLEPKDSGSCHFRHHNGGAAIRRTNSKESTLPKTLDSSTPMLPLDKA